MALLKCTICGGELDVNADISVGICQYCGSKITIPKNLDKKGNLYNLANFRRQNNEFDKAINIYEDILKDDNEDAEAHYGLVLSKYGIEYVKDPKTGERVPTCHRLRYSSILADSDYKAAIKYADDISKQVYSMEAERISRIVSRIVELASKEETYDIFICYKESTESDERTEDSRIAQDLYQQLERKGYRTFFARKTLENRVGAEYEPIIFSALNSAKVMIVLGTKPEHFQAVWVRNEWSRFLELIKEDNSKVIIPAYKGMSAYEMPDELSMFQSQDMGRLGFMEDLLEGIGKVMRNREPQAEISSNNVSVEKQESSIEHKLNNAETYKKLGEYEKAKAVYEKLTEDYTNDYRTWWGLAALLSADFTECKMDQQKMIEIKKCAQYSMALCDGEILLNLQSEYSRYITRIIEEHIKVMYQLAWEQNKKPSDKLIKWYNDFLDNDYRFDYGYGCILSDYMKEFKYGDEACIFFDRAIKNAPENEQQRLQNEYKEYLIGLYKYKIDNLQNQNIEMDNGVKNIIYTQEKQAIRSKELDEKKADIENDRSMWYNQVEKNRQVIKYLESYGTIWCVIASFILPVILFLIVGGIDEEAGYVSVIISIIVVVIVKLVLDKVILPNLRNSDEIYYRNLQNSYEKLADTKKEILELKEQKKEALRSRITLETKMKQNLQQIQELEAKIVDQQNKNIEKSMKVSEENNEIYCCKSCGFLFDVFVQNKKINDITECPVCGADVSNFYKLT